MSESRSYSARLEDHLPASERLSRLGAEGLRDIEILELIIGSSTKDAKVMARMIQDVIDVGVPTVPTLRAIPGVGTNLANRIIGLMEYGRRFGRSTRLKITSPADIVPKLLHWADRPQEIFMAVYLNGAQESIEIKVLTVGIVNRTLIHPREVFARAIELRATALIISHTHPSGALEPSREDRDATSRISQAGKLLGIEVLDHIIISDRGYYSFREQGDVFL